MIRAARVAAALLPLVGLALIWAAGARHYQAGTEWEVPIAGYDPRDMLRGHFVEFTYDWPGVEPFKGPPPEALCLEGTAPHLAQVRPAGASAPCPHRLLASRAEGEGWDALMRGRLYVDQDKAATIEQQLQRQDQRGVVTIRQREDGSFTPIAIRFRPLTPAEQAARAEQEEEAGSTRPPPPIMAQEARR
ncbi:MAG: hypothetical protein KatS3mg120_2810 [Erythrobacter sp.]|nr:MAG: hypothetical protein KatS3mg120_2810 [Erythrobacter sp.]